LASCLRSKFLHPKEIENYDTILPQRKRETFLASRWAAKEATFKAFSRWRIPFPDFYIHSQANGQPELSFEGMALELSNQLSLSKPLLSISHDGDYATATVILTKAPSL
jgi:holo-[acyl-carrier protein] synthase